MSCKILHRTYFNNDFIFFRPAISTEYIESDPPTYRSYYPTWAGLRDTFRRIVLEFGWQRRFEDFDRDSGYAITAIERHHGGFPQAEANLQIQVLHSPFYRNKAAYIVGKMINGHKKYPFAIPVLHGAQGRLYVDTMLLDSWRIGLLFSLNRAYVMVDMDAPSGYVLFLRHHADLLEPEFWRQTQKTIRSGQIEDFFPYPRFLRFCTAVAGRAGEEPESDTQRELFGATVPHLSPDLLPEAEIE